MLQAEESDKNFQEELDLKSELCPPEDGTLAPKHVGHTAVKIVVTRTVNFILGAIAPPPSGPWPPHS